MKIQESGHSRLSEINVTPFVDVMLVLLVIFMVTAPMMHQGIDVDLPEAETKEMSIEEDQIVVSVKESREIFIDRYPVNIEDLESRIRAIYETKAEREIFLGADKDELEFV